MEINIKLSAYTPLTPTDAKQIKDTKSTKDEILDLSDTSRLADELLYQDTNTVKAIKVGDQLIQIDRADLKKVLTTLKKELLDGKTKLREDFKELNFVENTGITLRISDFSPKTALDYMAKRAEVRLKITDNSELKRALSTDLDILKKHFHTGDVAGKILLQDMALLQRKGLLGDSDKALYEQVLSQAMKNFSTHKSPLVSTQDIQRLRPILERIANSVEPLQTLQLDEEGLSHLGEKEIPQEKQFQQVQDNLPAVTAAGEAAMNDLTMATREVGFTDYSQKKAANQGKKIHDVELGRSRMRIEFATQEVNKQLHLIQDKMLPAVENEMQGLEKQMEERTLQLLGITDITQKDAVLAKNPKLINTLKQDSVLQQLEASHSKAQGLYKSLLSQKETLEKSHLQGLTSLQEILKVSGEEHTRIGAVQEMSAAIDKGITELKDLQKQLAELKTSDFPDGVVKIRKQIQALSQELADKMKMVVDLSKQLKSTDKKTIKLLEEQLKSMETLATNFMPDKIEGLIQKLEKTRSDMIATLKQSSNVSQEEKDALVELDNKVKEVSTTKVSADKAVIHTYFTLKQQVERAELKKQALDLLTNGVKTEKDFKLLTSVMQDEGLLKELLSAYEAKYTAQVGTNGAKQGGREWLMIDYVRQMIQYQSNVLGKIDKNTSIDLLKTPEKVYAMITPDSLKAIDMLKKVSTAELKDPNDPKQVANHEKDFDNDFDLAVQYELNMEIYSKRADGKPLGVILMADGSDDLPGDLQTGNAVQLMGKTKSTLISFPLTYQNVGILRNLINTDKRVDAFATVGHGDTDGITVPINGTSVNVSFNGLIPSQTIKRVVMLNCNSAYVPGLEKAFPNTTDWQLNKTYYFSGFDSPDAHKPLKEEN